MENKEMENDREKFFFVENKEMENKYGKQTRKTTLLIYK